MKCPFCQFKDTQVLDTRVNEDGSSVKRRRRCANCEKRFNTFEHVELNLPLVVKSNGEREQFDEIKLKISFIKALHKRPVSIDIIDNALQGIKQEILASGHKEVNSRTIGDMVMEHLKTIDKIGYIRFASIYRAFQDVADFNDILQQV